MGAGRGVAAAAEVGAGLKAPADLVAVGCGAEGAVVAAGADVATGAGAWVAAGTGVDVAELPQATATSTSTNTMDGIRNLGLK